MTRLHRRALLATAAALASIVLHGQPTTADPGVVDLDGPTENVLDEPVAVLGTVTETSIALPVIGDIVDPVPAVPIPAISLPAIPLPAIPLPAIPLPAIPLPVVQLPAIPLPVVPLPVVQLPVIPPILAPPIPAPDIGSAADPPIASPPIVVPDVGDPPTVGGDGGGSPPVPESAGSAQSEPAVDQGQVIVPEATGTGPPAILGPADEVRARATRDSDRWSQSSAVRYQARDIVSAADRAGSSSSAALPSAQLGPPHRGPMSGSDGGSTPATGGTGRAVGQRTVPAATTELPLFRGGGRSPFVGLGQVLGALIALAIVVAVVRRAINSRGEWLEEAVDHGREPIDRVLAPARSNTREPPRRVSADTRPNRREPSRVSADTRPNRREPGSGVGGRPTPRAGRDRRALRSRRARSNRPNAGRDALRRQRGRRAAG